MAGHWYLLSSLPTPQFGSPPPIGLADYIAYCGRVDPGLEGDLSLLALLPPQPLPACSGFLSRFWARETAFRNELARQRALRSGSDSGPWLRPELPGGQDAGLAETARGLARSDDPLEAELALERSRWDWLCAQIGLDAFGDEAVLAYGLKILILERLSRFREEAGAAEYTRVYQAVLGAAARDGVA